MREAHAPTIAARILGSRDRRARSPPRRGANRPRAAGPRGWRSRSSPRCCAGSTPPPIRRGAPPSASSGTTRARGPTTPATARCGARGAPTTGTRSTSRRSSPALEYASFAAFGVGTWQARVGADDARRGRGRSRSARRGARRRTPGRPRRRRSCSPPTTSARCTTAPRSWKAPMAAAIVVSWWAFAKAQERPAWGAVAGVAAIAAYFIKAAAVFFVGAIGLTALVAVALPRWPAIAPAIGGAPPACGRSPASPSPASSRSRSSSGRSGAEYRFYNWQMSVTRKPSYDVAVARRTGSRGSRCCTTCCRGCGWSWRSAWRRSSRARSTGSGARRPSSCSCSGSASASLELLLHDVGNERRFVFLIPAFTALAALAHRRRSRHRAGLARRRCAAGSACCSRAAGALRRLRRRRDRWSASPSSTTCARRSGAAPRSRSPRHAAAWVFRQRLAAAAPPAVDAGGGGASWSPSSPPAAPAQFVQFAAGRSYKNVEASRELGRRLPPGTLVHGKLANGLALENRIRPIFVGRSSAITRTGSRGTMYHGC